MNHQDVNIVGAEPAQALFSLVEYRHMQKAALIDVVTSVCYTRADQRDTSDVVHLFMVDKESDFRDDDDIFPGDIVL